MTFKKWITNGAAAQYDFRTHVRSGDAPAFLCACVDDVEVNYFAPNSFKDQVALTGAKHCPFPEVEEKYAGQYPATAETAHAYDVHQLRAV